MPDALTRSQREANYLRRGRKVLTPRQTRRIRKKENRALAASSE